MPYWHEHFAAVSHILSWRMCGKPAVLLCKQEAAQQKPVLVTLHAAYQSSCTSC